MGSPSCGSPGLHPHSLCCSHHGVSTAWRSDHGHAVLSAHNGAPPGRRWRRVHRPGGWGVGLRPPQVTRVLKPLTRGRSQGCPAGPADNPGACRVWSIPGQQDSGVLVWVRLRGTPRGEEGPQEASAVSRGDQRVGPGEAVCPQRGPPQGRWPGRDAHGDTPGDALVSPSSVCSGVALSPLCSQAHHILHASEARPSQGDLRGCPASAPPATPASRPWRASQPLRPHGPWGPGSAAVRRPGHHPSETKPRTAGRSLALAIKFP